MSSWFTCSKPGLGVWWWCWWWWWWCNKGAFIWCGVKIIVLCWCCCCACKPFTSIGANELLLLLLLLCEVVLLFPPVGLWCKSLVFCSSESLHDSDEPFFTLPGFEPLCVFTCFAKWSERMKRLLHTGQANLLNGKHWESFVKIKLRTKVYLNTDLFSPVWVLRWRWSSSERVKRLPQNSQLHTNGRSPVCQRRCAFRWLVLPYTLPHPGMWQLWMFFLRKWTPAGPRRSASWQFGQSQVARPA